AAVFLSFAAVVDRGAGAGRAELVAAGVSAAGADCAAFVEAAAVVVWAAGAPDTATFLSSLCQFPFSSKRPSSAVFIALGISDSVLVALASSFIASTDWRVSFAILIAWLFG